LASFLVLLGYFKLVNLLFNMEEHQILEQVADGVVFEYFDLLALVIWNFPL